MEVREDGCNAFLLDDVLPQVLEPLVLLEVVLEVAELEVVLLIGW